MTETRSVLLSAIMLLVVLAGGLRAASARPNADSFGDIVTAGNELYGQKRFADAREKYLQAYAINPVSMLLYNVANCYRREEKPQEAASYFRKFLDTEPPDPLPRDEFEARQKAQAHYLRITAAMESSSTAPTPEEPPPAESEAIAQEAAPLDPAPQLNPAPQPPEMTTSKSGERTTSGSALRITAWVSVGVGFAGLLGVIAFDSLARDAVETKNRVPSQDNADRVEQYELLVNASWAATGIGLVGGAALYWLSRPSRRHRDNGASLGVDVHPLPGGAAASVSMRF